MQTPSPLWRLAPWLIFFLVFVVQALSPRTASGDSRWTVPEALNMIQHGHSYLDEYIDLIRRDRYYAVECVGPGGRVLDITDGSCPGHYYNSFPASVAALSAPFLLSLRVAAPVVAHIAPAGVVRAHPELGSLLAGDLVAAHAVVEEWIASFFVALTAVVMYAIGRRFVSDRQAVLLALVFAFATPEWSSGSRAFGQHAPSAFLIALTIYLFVAAEKKPTLAGYAGLTVAAAYAVRPTNSLLAIFALVYVAKRYRGELWRFLLWTLPVAVPFLIYNFTVYHGIFSPYYTEHPEAALSGGLAGQIAAALAGQLISPSRGVLIFTPVLVASIYGMVVAWKRRWEWPLSGYLIVWTIAHWILISVYVGFWWAGHSYGPRWFTDLMPVFVFFLIPAIQAWKGFAAGPRRAGAAAFCVLAAASVFIHARGAWSLAAQDWNGSPVDVDQNPARVWDWSDPQFLRGLH